MVRFEDDRLVIEIPVTSRTQAIEAWSDLHTALCDMMYYITQDTISDDTYHNLPMLLGYMLPPWDDMIRMTTGKTNA